MRKYWSLTDIAAPLVHGVGQEGVFGSSQQAGPHPPGGVGGGEVPGPPQLPPAFHPPPLPYAAVGGAVFFNQPETQDKFFNHIIILTVPTLVS